MSFAARDQSVLLTAFASFMGRALKPEAEVR